MTSPHRPRAPLRAPQEQHGLSVHEQFLLVDAYRSGTPIEELAARFDVHRPTVSGVLARRDVPRRYRKLGPEGLAEDRRLYESGWSFARVGAELGVDLKTIHSAFKRAGIPTRPQTGQ